MLVPAGIEVVLFDLDGVVIPLRDFTAGVRRSGIGSAQLEEFARGVFPGVAELQSVPADATVRSG